MYKNGWGTEQDDAKAVFWLRRAADKGMPSAQRVLGAMYYYGHGVEQDYVEAYKWFDLAVMRGHQEAAEAREGVARRMTEGQIIQAETRAREWLAKQKGS